MSSSIQALGLIECASLIYDEGLQHGAAQIARNRGGLGKFLDCQPVVEHQEQNRFFSTGNSTS